MSARTRRGLAPALLPLEGRELLSSTGGAWGSASPSLGGADVMQIAQARSHGAEVAAAAASDSAADPGSPGGGFPAPNPSAASPLLGQGEPTPAERARQRFRAEFSGPFRTLPPRFTDQRQILYLRGIGTSTAFLHGDYDMAIVLPRDRSQPITGFAYLDDKNTNAGATLGLDLAADPASLDRKGRPTRLTFTSDPNIYSGTFFVTQSTGVVTVRYGKGNASASFQGRLYVSGLTSTLQNTDLYARRGR